jgi:hypothetical protein
MPAVYVNYTERSPLSETGNGFRVGAKLSEQWSENENLNLHLKWVYSAQNLSTLL